MSKMRTKRSEGGATKIPKWELSPPLAFDANLLFHDGARMDSDQLALSLALVFNDLKDYSWWQYVLDQGFRKDAQTPGTGNFGQHGGMCVHIERLVLSTIREMCNLLWLNSETLKSKYFKECADDLRSSSPPAFRAWQSVLVASGATNPHAPITSNKLVSTLKTIRDAVGFHYKDSAQLRSGYETWRRANPSVSAYISLGQDADGTRFYLADAAAQSFMDSSMEPDVRAKLRELVRDTAHALRMVVESYFNHRCLEVPSLAGSYGSTLQPYRRRKPR